MFQGEATGGGGAKLVSILKTQSHRGGLRTTQRRMKRIRKGGVPSGRGNKQP